MPFGRSRTEAAARQVRIIEAEGPDEVRAYALESLVEALTWAGEAEKALVPFVKLLRWWDLHPEHFDSGDQNILFWEFGWIVNDLSRTPTVSVEKVDRVLEDMEKRFSLANRGMERVWCSRLEWALLRRSEDLEKTFTTWLTMPLDDEDSCVACHKEYHAGYLLEIGDIHGAVAILEAGIVAELSCSREPASMLSVLAWCYLELERLEDAEKVLPTALGELKSATSMSVLIAYARLFEVFARGHDKTRALELIAKIAESIETASAYVRLETLRHLIAGMRCLSEQGYAQETITFGSDEDTIAHLVDSFDTQATELSEAFDHRHGNTVQADRLARSRKVHSTSRPLVFVQPERPSFVAGTTSASHDVTWNRDRAYLDQAEDAYQDGDHTQAADLYRIAAEQAQSEGLLLEAGWCWAEAARNAQEISQFDVAAHDYMEAQTRLKAAGATLEEITPMFIAWAPVVQENHYRKYVDMALYDYPTPARAHGTDKIEEILPIVFQSSMVNTPLIKKYVLARAELRDSVARVLATWGSLEDKIEAIDMVEESATRFTLLGRSDAAAHSWWLAARLAAEVNPALVTPNYSKALQEFKAVGQRGRVFGAQVAGDYGEYLRTLGRYDEASKVEESWKDE
jgi:tetratricopeptide (TPR) repeat protein